MDNDNHLFRTPTNDSNKLRSLELIVDFASCIRQLLENSVDAGSSEVVVKVDVSKFAITVSDNGRGIPIVGMKDLGSLRYLSSKTYTPGHYGFRGEAIHSIANLSVLEIQSRFSSSTLTSTKLISFGDTLSTVVDSTKSQHGTTIRIVDLFRNWPVRRRNMKSRVQLARIKEMMYHLSLLNHHVSFTLIDTHQNKMIWNTKAAPSLIYRVCDIACLDHRKHQLNDVCLEFEGYRIEGVVSMCCLGDGEVKPLLHEMFVNKMPLPPNNEFIQLMLSVVYDNTDAAAFVNRHAGRGPVQNLVPNFVLNISCSSELCDVFLEPDKSNVFVRNPSTVQYLLLRILHDVSGLRLEENFVKYNKAVQSRLERYQLHHLHSPTEPVVPIELDSQDSYPIEPEHFPYSHNGYIDYIHHNEFSYSQKENVAVACTDEIDSQTIYQPPLHTTDEWYHQTHVDIISDQENHLSTPCYDDQLAYQTLQTYQYDPLQTFTKRSALREEACDNDQSCIEGDAREWDQASKGQKTSLRKRVRLSFGEVFFPKQSGESHTSSGLQLRSSLEQNEMGKEGLVGGEVLAAQESSRIEPKNKTYEQPNSIKQVEVDETEPINDIDEPLLPTASVRYRAADQNTFKKSFLTNSHKQQNLSMKPIRSKNVVNISKKMLSSAKVIAQADLKFIIARAGNSLLCIDQHAADERIQLEKLESEVFGDSNNGFKNLITTELSPPQLLLVTKQEYALMELHEASLAAYGFKVNLSSTTSMNEQDSANHEQKGTGQQLKVWVSTVPRILNTTLTLSDLKAILHQLHDFDPLGHGLFIRPSIMQYILCSKACRSAIMFGDKLLKEECCELVEKLSKCNFPFQCAHGRPSSILILKDVRQLDVLNNITSSANEKAGTNEDCKQKVNISVTSATTTSKRRSKWNSMKNQKPDLQKLS